MAEEVRTRKTTTLVEVDEVAEVEVETSVVVVGAIEAIAAEEAEEDGAVVAMAIGHLTMLVREGRIRERHRPTMQLLLMKISRLCKSNIRLHNSSSNNSSNNTNSFSNNSKE